jgi:hypothetical protein
MQAALQWSPLRGACTQCCKAAREPNSSSADLAVPDCSQGVLRLATAGGGDVIGAGGGGWLVTDALR